MRCQRIRCKSVPQATNVWNYKIYSPLLEGDSLCCMYEIALPHTYENCSFMVSGTATYLRNSLQKGL
jgi:hypothetical protein